MSNLVPTYHALAFRESDGRGRSVWVVQGIGFDICAQTHDVAHVAEAFAKTTLMTILVNEKLGEIGLDKIPQAPEEFRQRHADAKGFEVIKEMHHKGEHLFTVYVRIEYDGLIRQAV